MPNNGQDPSGLLQVIPSSERTPEQVVRWHAGRESATYHLLRKPATLDELTTYGLPLAVWRDNNSLTYIYPDSSKAHHPCNDEVFLKLTDYGDGPHLDIFGATDSAIAETGAFFLELIKPKDNHSLHIGCCNRHFDFRPARSHCLTRLVGKDSPRHIVFHHLTLSAEQSVVLSTQSHPTKLSFWTCKFEDGGRAFVDGLQNRNSSFGSLHFLESIALDDGNLERLFALKIIERLELPRLDDAFALLPFSAEVDHLEYEVSSCSLLKADLPSLDIVATKLSLSIHFADEKFPTNFILAFWRHLASLGHFLELKISLYGIVGSDLPSCVVEDIMRAAMANSRLKVLDLSKHHNDCVWNKHVGKFFEGVKGHKALRTLRIAVNYGDDVGAFGPNSSYLQLLLSCNRNLIVTDGDELAYTDGELIDELYSLNRFYRGSSDLVGHPQSDRISLVATALLVRSSNNFQRSALLLSNHVDALNEIVLFAKLNETDEQEPSLQFPEDDVRKRRERIQQTRAAKRK
jgi:hypothetical protein